MENTSPAPIAATIALEMIGPMLGIVIRRSQAGSWATTFAISADRMRDMPIGTDVAHTASVSLIGQYSAANFSSASDGHGGTIIGETPAAAGEPAALAAPHHGKPAARVGTWDCYDTLDVFRGPLERFGVAGC